MPTPEKFLKKFTVRQLQQLIREQGKTANDKLSEIRESGASALSPVYIRKYEPYLSQFGTKTKQMFSLSGEGKKADLINRLQNIQSFNASIGNSEQIKEQAQKEADRVGVEIEDLKEYWRLVHYGYDAVAYRVDSGSIQTIVSERMRKGQSSATIKRAITMAAKKADSGDDYINKFSAGGKWL